jgi:hypothetical protein
VVEGARLESESPEQCQATSTQLIAYALSDLAAQNDHSVCVAIARYSSRFRGARKRWVLPSSSSGTFYWFAENRSSRWRGGRPIPPPRVAAAILFVRNPHRHHAQSVVERSFCPNRPPVVEKDFDGPPHGDPPSDQQTFLKNLSDVIADEAPNEISGGQRDAECADANDEARPATAKELAQPASRKLRAVTEEFVNGVPELGRFVRQSGRPVQVDREPESRRRRSLFRPIRDEFLGVWIEVSFAER